MTTGKKIHESRKSAGIKAADLATAVGVSAATISNVERDAYSDGAPPLLVVKISNFLDDKTILTTYLENNPAYQAVIPKIFTDLNNIKRDPAIIFSRFATEAAEAVEAARILEEIFSNAEPANHPSFCEVLKAKMEQIIDVKRAVEILELQLVASEAMTEADRCEIYARQHQKCIDHGHHKPEQVN